MKIFISVIIVLALEALCAIGKAEGNYNTISDSLYLIKQQIDPDNLNIL